MSKFCIVRPPSLPAYHDTDIKEDPIISAINGYFHSIQLPENEYDIFDFMLDKTITYQSLLEKPYKAYVLVARDVGESYRYTLRVSELLARDTSAKIFLYGQVAPLRFSPLAKNVEIINQAERDLAEKLGLSTEGAHFENGLNYISYFHRVHLEDWQEKRKKGVIETTRGCPYKCNFCFINVGESYEKRWQIRDNESIIEDLKNYQAQGINRFVFLDSEFLGANPKQHIQKAELLRLIIKELKPIKYMILCRADTLLKFNDYDLLKASGLDKVLVGVESLYQPDLDALKKQTTVETLVNSITELLERKIECCLTYLTFHRNTTLEGLRANLLETAKLYEHPNASYLGMPNFTFNMEISRDVKELKNQLKSTTYIKPLLVARGQLNADLAIFPTTMEPLIELYRMLQYEWVVKKCELLRAKVSASHEDQNKITCWFDQLGKFCINIMMEYLTKFEQGEIRFDNLKTFKEDLFQQYSRFYQVLPNTLQSLSTYEHAKTLDYKTDVAMADHGWDKIIPPADSCLVI